MDIGSRPTGTEAEREAADYIRGQLASYGYDAELQPFTFDVFSDAGTAMRVLSPQPREVQAYPLEPSANGSVEGNLAAAGLGRPQEFPAGMKGKIALIKRGEITFSEKVANAAAAGAKAAVIYNNQSGLFAGQLGGPSAIPGAGISREDGEALINLLKEGAVSVRLEVKTRSGPTESQNVVARPPDGECRVIVGGHYDSVPAGPGANDNGSGTSTSIEIARVLASDGELDDVCFVLFGAEEVGLIGSAHFAESLTPDETQQIEGMLNFDMVSVGTDWLIAGSQEMVSVAAQEADRLKIVYDVSDAAPGGLGSDHSSFIEQDIPSVFFHRLGDPHYHTAQDTDEFVQADRMEEIGRLGLAVIDELLSGR